jgi:hypothetical protein
MYSNSLLPQNKEIADIKVCISILDGWVSFAITYINNFVINLLWIRVIIAYNLFIDCLAF